MDISEDQSYANEDDKDMTLEKSKRGRKKRIENQSNEPSAPAETKSDTEDMNKEERRTRRIDLKRKNKKDFR